jgi:hypothetical protein
MGSGMATALDHAQKPELDQEQAPAQDERIPGFTLCVPPYAPPCVDNAPKGRANAACDEELRIYIETVFHYRECLTFEMERAIRESNDVIDRWKCRKAVGKCRK